MKPFRHRQHSSERENTRLSGKSVQEVSKQQPIGNGRHPKTDLCYWERAIFQPTYTRYGQVWKVGDADRREAETFPTIFYPRCTILTPRG